MNTTGDCTLLKGAAKNHADPEPPPTLSTVRAAGVQSGTGPNNSDSMERHCQCLVLALDYSKRHNQQLYSEIQQLKQEKKDLQDQQGKEHEKKTCVFKAVKADLEQHRLSVQMLASEKPSLQSALAPTQRVANESALEQEALTSHLQAAQQRVTELKLQLSAVSTMQKETENNNTELMKALNHVKVQFQEKARSYEDLEDKNTKLHKRLEVLLTQKADMRIQIHKCQETLVEQAELQRQLNDMKELVTALKVEKDTFAEELRAESSAGKEKVQQLSEQVSQLREEKKQGERQVWELENNLVELRAQLAELQPPKPPTGPSEAEQQLQAQALQLQKELKSLEGQLHMQLKENQSLCLQNLEQRQRLRVLEKKAEERDQHAEAWLKIFEMMEKEQKTKRRMLVRNQELKDELAQLQDAVQRLSAEKQELASLLRSEHQEKTNLREKLEELEEKEVPGGKEMAELKSQAAEDLQELRDKYLAQVQEVIATREQHRASGQQLTSKKEALKQHLLRQSHLLEQLNQEHGRHKLLAQMEREKFQDTLKCLEATRRENAQLQAQLSTMAFLREGEGLSQEGDKGEEATPPTGTVPEDVDNLQSMWDFYMEALSIAECKKARLSRQLQEQQARCGCLSQLAAQCQRKLERQASFPKRWLQGLLGGWKQEIQTPKKNLHVCFPEDLADKVDTQSPVDALQHRCSQLSQHMATIEETIVFYKEQMNILEKLCQEKDKCVSQLSEGKRRKMKELKELLLRLAGEGTECQDVVLAAAQAPAAEVPSHLSGPMQREVVQEQQEFKDIHLREKLGPVPAEAGAPGPLENPTAEPPVLLLPAIQPHQEPAGLGQGPCLPFFYKTGRNDTLGIITI
ncbi:golgin subfamily A member 2-like [Perognathus longimembris pacificus]|uniref:golgin subfamily A member 2-like n=1 Tax=Perognathus longimembris pacificus TaxID=214514 RepID=UPI00201A0418|nr:golgin subfamily A member 2-like [Perognathus longimembris pacificus]